MGEEDTNLKIQPQIQETEVYCAVCGFRCGLRPKFAGHVGEFTSMKICVEGCLSVCFPLSCLAGWISFFALPDGLCHLVKDHNPSSIFVCCVIYDLEGSTDAILQDALPSRSYMHTRRRIHAYIFALTQTCMMRI